MWNELARKAWLGVLIAGALSQLVACGDGDHLRAKPSNPEETASGSSPSSSFGITAHVAVDGHPDQSGWVRIPPLDLNNWGGNAPTGAAPDSDQSDGGPGPESQGFKTPGLRTQATVGQGDAGIDTNEQDKRLNYAPGWSLLYWAASACYTATVPAEAVTTMQPNLFITDHPWLLHNNRTVRDFYIFSYINGAGGGGGAQYANPDDLNCDTLLAMQETLLCAADHLAQLGDSPGTVTWSGSDGRAGSSAITVTVPPQRSDDVFIARDMALNALAHLLRLDTKMRGTSYSNSCVNQYGSVAAGNTSAMSALLAPGYAQSTYFDSPPLTGTSDLKAAAARRLARKASVLTSAARLTKDLVDRSVQADIAGAQQLLSASSDYQAGARAAWGMADGQSPYNTLRHALRTTFGRLEIGNNGTDDDTSLVNGAFGSSGTVSDWAAHGITRDDPRCEIGAAPGVIFTRIGGSAGSTALDELLHIKGLSARWDDAPPKTAGETLALSMLDHEGIIFPPAMNQSAGAQSAVQALALANAATRAGAASVTEFLATKAGDAFNTTLNSITPAEMSFAMAREYDAFRLLTETEPETASSPTTTTNDLDLAARAAGLATQTSSGINSAGGIVLAKPIPRDDLAIDPMASLSQAQNLSSCGVYPIDFGSSITVDALSYHNGDVSGFQNPFLLAEGYRRILGQITSSSNGVSPLAKVQAFSQVASAEIKTWAGPGTFLTTQSADATKQEVYLVNLTSSDLGTVVSTDRNTELDDLQLRLALVSNSTAPAAAANCAAGLKSSCSTVGSTIRKATVRPVEVAMNSSLGAGLDAPTVKLTFPPDPSPDHGSHLVLLPQPGKPGKVLAWLKGTVGSEWFVESFSNEQRALVQKIFGIDKSAVPTRTCANVAPLSLPSDYCVAGMTRDAFVPLANELNSSGDPLDNSWQTYLSLADSAATKADTLGAEMIADGLSSDVQRASASEKVADLCGGFTGVANVTSSGGNISIPQDDQQLNSCVNPDLIDIVFLRNDPFVAEANDGPTNVSTYQAIWDTYCANSKVTSKPPFCGTKHRGDKITHRGMGLHSSSVTPPTGDVNQACAPLVGGQDRAGNSVAAALAMRAAGGPDPALNLQQYNAAVALPSSTNGAIGAALQKLQLDEDPGGGWLLTSGQQILTGSPERVAAALTDGNTTSPHDIWPYCTTLSGMSPCSNTATWLSRVLTNPAGTGGLRGTVERTLFYMGAMSGSISQGHVRMPLPVVDRTSLPVTNASLPSIALYSPGKFADNGNSSFSIQVGDYTGEDLWGAPQERAAMGDVFVPVSPSGFASSHPGGPSWRTAAYSPAAPLKYVMATNDAIAFDPALVSGRTDDSAGRQYLGEWLKQMGQAYLQADPGVPSVSTPTFLQQVEEASFFTKGKLCNGGNFSHGRSVCAGAPGAPTFFYYSPGWQSLPDGCDTAGSPDRSDGLATTNYMKNGTFNGDDHHNLTWISAATASGVTVPYNPAAARQEADSGGYYFVHDIRGVTGCDDNSNSNGSSNQMLLTETCGSFNWRSVPWAWGEGFTRSVWHDRLKPSVCPPSQRLEMFLDTDLQDRATAMETLVRGLSLSCLSANSSVAVQLAVPPPPIKTVDDVRYLSAWVSQLGFSVDALASYLYLVNVPADVLDVASNGGTNGEAAGSAQRGTGLLDLQQNMNLIEHGFATVGANIQAISRAIDKTGVQLSILDDEGQARSLQIAAAQLNNERDKELAFVSLVDGTLKTMSTGLGVGVGIAQSAGGSVEGIGQTAEAAGQMVDAVSQIAAAGINIEFDSKIDSNLSAQASNSAKTQSDQEALTVVDLSDTVATLDQSIDAAFSGIKNDGIAALKSLALLTQNQMDAKIALATASGADFVNINGQLAPLHVNTVYRRQFDIAKQRYTQALEGAKRAAYLARLSIEQRLGVRLDELHQHIGPLESPATWVDDLCTVQGVDYNKLNTATATADGSLDKSEEDRLIRGFANQYIGDYVSKLREFVQFYNVEYPFKESDDVAILSLREDLPSSLISCSGPSRNLLFYSDRLDVQSPDVTSATASLDAPDSTLVSRAGWRSTGCDTSSCLSVQRGETILTDSPLPVAGPGGATFLSTIAKTAQGLFVGVAPPVAVFQTVDLQSGTSYVLSWWDIARQADGTKKVSSTKAPTYQVGIFDKAWNLVGGSTFLPESNWGDRRSLRIFANDDGQYHVMFNVAPPGTVGAGLGIANVQLEKSQPDNLNGSPYEANAGSLTHVSGRCDNDSPSQLRDRFQRKCDQLGCYYELKDVLTLDTELLNQGSSSLIGKLAAGNFNYRNGTVAVNFVGTGVIDCSRSTSASCNGSAYVDYDLEHVAYNVPMDDYSGQIRCFDFGQGAIRSGKGLASERFITLPMGAADREAINQSPFLKADFSGRPLSGSYRLRVMDSPSLVWSNVQDIQLVFGYRYWSRVQQSPGH